MDIQTILAIAEKHNNPDAEIQYRAIRITPAGSWADGHSLSIDSMIEGVDRKVYEYRIKPKIVSLNGEELPRPVKLLGDDDTILLSEVSDVYWLSEVVDFAFASKEDVDKWKSVLYKLINS